MRLFKRAVSVMASIALLLGSCIFSIPVFAASELSLTYSYSSSYIKPGENVTVTVSLDNYQGNADVGDILGLQVDVLLDSTKVDFVSATPLLPTEAGDFVQAGHNSATDTVSLLYISLNTEQIALPRTTTDLFSFVVTAKSSITTDTPVHFTVSKFLVNDGSNRSIPVLEGPTFYVLATNPIITLNGAPNTGEPYHTAVTVSFNKGNSTISKDGGPAMAITSGYVATTSGSYLVVVTDAAGNTASESFEIELNTQLSLEYRYSATHVKPGQEVTITVSLSDYDSPDVVALYGLQVDVQLDTALVDFKAGSGVSLVTVESSDYVAVNYNASTQKVSFIYLSLNDALLPLDKANSDLFSFTVIAKSDITTDETVEFSIPKFSYSDGTTNINQPVVGGPSFQILGALPVITLNGAPNAGTYNTAVTVTFDKGSATISKNGGEAMPITSGYVATTSGSYLVVVTDAAGNTASESFEIVSPLSLQYRSSATHVKPGQEVTITVSLNDYDSAYASAIYGLQVDVQLDTALVDFKAGSGVSLVTVESSDYVAVNYNASTQKVSFFYVSLNDQLLPLDKSTTDLFSFTVTAKSDITTDETVQLNISRFSYSDGTTNTTQPVVGGPSFQVLGALPVITLNGAPNTGEVYEEPVIVEFNKGTATISKDGGEAIPIPSGYEVPYEGTYVVTVTDAAGNVASETFTINMHIDISLTYEVSKPVAKPGDTVTITVSLKDYQRIDINALLGMQIEMLLDEALVSYLSGQSLLSVNPGDFTEVNYNPDTGKVTLLYLSLNPELLPLSKTNVAAFSFDVMVNPDLTADATATFEVVRFAVSDGTNRDITVSGGISFDILATRPVVTLNGAANTGEIYTGDVVLAFDKGTATISKNGGEAMPITSGTVINQNGTYVVTVTDSIGNVTIETFTILYPVASIAMASLPSTLSYVEGTNFDPAGGEIRVTYSNGETESVALTADMCDVTNVGTELGSKTVTVTYGGQSTTFDITVVAKSVVGIVVKTNPDTLTYVEGTNFDPTGGVITVSYNNGTSEDIDLTADMCDVTNVGTELGNKTVTVTYGGQTTTFEITVVAKSVIGIAVKTNPTTLTYVEGTNFDPTGGVITVSYNNGTSEDIELTADMCDVTNVGNVLGSKTVTVTYGGKTTTFQITVVAKSVTAITMKTNPTTLTYVEGTTFNPAGGVITVSYNNGTSEDINLTTQMCDVTNVGNVLGSKTVTVTYGGKTTTFQITVVAKSVTGITIKTMPTKTSYKTGEDLDLSGGVITVSYNNNTTADLPMTAATVSGYDPTKLGTQTVTLTLDGKTVTFEVTTTASIVYGDINNDGNVTCTDARLVLQAVVGKITLTEEQQLAADVNGNGKVDITDARLILQYSVKKIFQFPVEEE